MPFEPKHKVELDPPKDDVISQDYLSKCDGSNAEYPTYVAIKVCHDIPDCQPAGILTEGKGTVFDVSGNKSYGPEGGYKVFAGKDASRALAQSSLKPEDCRPDWQDLDDTSKKTLNDWYTYFSKRYNIKGKVEGATNT
ncbi:uncharacterized protein LTR77_006923 [Saxophila tyrrhenica]|uniref:Cytochrome b5 heme-binding domain-containing protein n=1 Tax=Saxophila tyrrhenica TaxID=1690608 RepID=A0AAV9PA06_9PEZI|nr:hypothetical protein LTR77_006923 [Saxophila tyrrhenica]